MDEPGAADRAEKIARYKTLLRGVIDRRPSGLRGRLAMALGKHKSFVSQITNPSYTVPIPAVDLPTIFEICHLAPAEREQFLGLYREAHPERMQRPPRAANAPHELRIALPQFQTEATARDVEAMILDFAARTIRLAQRAERVAGNESDKRRKQP
jgi:hypothetical protein